MHILTPSDWEQFEREGYVVVRDVLDPVADLAPVVTEFDQVLDGITEGLVREGRLQSQHRGLPFTERLMQVCLESGRNFPQEFDISLPQTGVKHDTPINVGPAMFKLLTAPRLLDLVEDMIGPEIYSNPVQHVRMKLPKRAVPAGPFSGLISQIPWHQDNGVILPEADESRILTVWLPLNRSTVENGCMQVIPRSHRSEVMAHCQAEKGLTIPDSLLPPSAPIPLPMDPGSVLLMTQRTIHSSLDNQTENEVRLSLDLRYQQIGVPTGRPAFPGFVARSKAHPESVVNDPAAWASMWLNARGHLAATENPLFNRWHPGLAVCA
jgi:hypothetical protein